MTSSRIFPYFDLGDDSREVLKKSDARATTPVTQNPNPDNVETQLVPIDEPFYRSYDYEAAALGGTVLFRFDTLSASGRATDALSPSNVTTEVAEPGGLTEGLLRTDDGAEPSGSALFIPAGQTVGLRLKEPVWPGSLVFWLETEGSAEATPSPSTILRTTPTPPEDAATPIVQGSMLVRLEETGHLTFETLDETDTLLRSVTSADPITDGQVHSFIYADDGTTVTMYVDGVAV